MYNPDTDLLFPPRIIPSLLETRGPVWRNLVDRVSAASDESIERLAFILLMVRLSGCISCNSDSFRAMQGCTACARQALKRFRGMDEDLAASFESAKTEVKQYMHKNT